MSLCQNTSSTISIPPCNHLWLLSLFWYHTSSSLIITSTPSFLPSSLKTIQARGIFLSSDLRPGMATPATMASATIPWGSVSSTCSISKGDTGPVGVLNVSLSLPTMLHEEIHRSQSNKRKNQLTKNSHFGLFEPNLRSVPNH